MANPTQARRRGRNDPSSQRAYPAHGWPICEAKEQLGGFTLIDLPDLDAAIALAERSPLARIGSIEVRPLKHSAGVSARHDGKARYAFGQHQSRAGAGALILVKGPACGLEATRSRPWRQPGRCMRRELKNSRQNAT